MAKLRIEDFQSWPQEEKDKYYVRVRAQQETRKKVERKVTTTISYLKGSCRFLGTIKPTPYSYRNLLEQAIETAIEIVEDLPDDFFESEKVPAGVWFGMHIDAHVSNDSDEPLEKAQKLIAVFQARRKRGEVLRMIAALEDTTGRLPEEAAAYKAKAAELRKSLEITLD